MKKLFLLMCVMVASVSTFAQVEKGKFTIQPTAGGNMVKYSGGDMATGMSFGYLGGVDLGYQFTDNFALTVGAFYASENCKAAKGSNYEGETFKISNLNIPVLANYYITEGFSVKAGVQPMVKLSSDFTYYKSFNLAIPVGVGYEFNNIVLDARYNFGILEIENGSGLRSNVVQVTLGYKFAL